MGAAPEMLRTPKEFAALQQSSKSKVHPLLVARFAPNTIERTRFGFSTGRRLGGAVTRNRVRRRLREAVRALGPRIDPGWDVLIVARQSSATATYAALADGLEQVLRSARVLTESTDGAAKERDTDLDTDRGQETGNPGKGNGDRGPEAVS
jgi:ribonuclease P protein component